MSRTAERIRTTRKGELHPLTVAVWVFAPVIALALGCVVLAVAPIQQFFGVDGFVKLALVLAVFSVCEERMLAKLLPAPGDLSSWFSRGRIGELGTAMAVARMKPDLPRARHMVLLKRILILGFWVCWLPGIFVSYEYRSYVPALIAIPAISLLRLWFLQHMVNWWRTLEDALDNLMMTDHLLGDTAVGQSFQPIWGLEGGERFNLINPWAFRYPASRDEHQRPEP